MPSIDGLHGGNVDLLGQNDAHTNEGSMFVAPALVALLCAVTLSLLALWVCEPGRPEQTMHAKAKRIVHRRSEFALDNPEDMQRGADARRSVGLVTSELFDDANATTPGSLGLTSDSSVVPALLESSTTKTEVVIFRVTDVPFIPSATLAAYPSPPYIPAVGRGKVAMPRSPVGSVHEQLAHDFDQTHVDAVAAALVVPVMLAITLGWVVAVLLRAVQILRKRRREKRQDQRQEQWQISTALYEVAMLRKHLGLDGTGIHRPTGSESVHISHLFKALVDTRAQLKCWQRTVLAEQNLEDEHTEEEIEALESLVASEATHRYRVDALHNAKIKDDILVAQVQTELGDLKDRQSGVETYQAHNDAAQTELQHQYRNAVKKLLLMRASNYNLAKELAELGDQIVELQRQKEQADGRAAHLETALQKHGSMITQLQPEKDDELTQLQERLPVQDSNFETQGEAQPDSKHPATPTQANARQEAEDSADELYYATPPALRKAENANPAPSTADNSAEFNPTAPDFAPLSTDDAFIESSGSSERESAPSMLCVSSGPSLGHNMNPQPLPGSNAAHSSDVLLSQDALATEDAEPFPIKPKWHRGTRGKGKPILSAHEKQLRDEMKRMAAILEAQDSTEENGSSASANDKSLANSENKADGEKRAEKKSRKRGTRGSGRKIKTKNGEGNMTGGRAGAGIEAAAAAAGVATPSMSPLPPHRQSAQPPVESNHSYPTNPEWSPSESGRSNAVGVVGDNQTSDKHARKVDDTAPKLPPAGPEAWLATRQATIDKPSPFSVGLASSKWA